MRARTVAAIIPAFNEQEYIGDTVAALAGIPEITEIVVVDDASTDRTAALAAGAGARVITLPGNMGKGAALNKGVTAVTADVYLLLDGDLGASAADARLLLAPVMAGEADMTVAQFPPPRRKGGFGLVKGLARFGIKLYTGLEMKSPLSGQRAMTRQVLDSVFPFASGYGVEVGLTIRAARAGFRVMEVPVQMTHAETGRDLKGFMHRGRQFWHIALVLAGTVLVKKPILR
ncbi:glycosyltransferase family 2 protein [Desulfallas sp. Bu1-1]|jgi:glycosyltransferase involved in cell wall biosynthesis|uniref:glycosyltransferase family 2 protein n=1 Tax=Desulfallas sp. Bu1-1 TaxID=2787620 RepID=UPI0018A017EE|nr:glycosyltransferase family 2 protein [Desulfallas sp. Bu1-1]MBF7082075.1 glycosyltransferase family 2 protein [Desulfallas sp. Bu1-1]